MQNTAMVAIYATITTLATEEYLGQTRILFYYLKTCWLVFENKLENIHWLISNDWKLTFDSF